VPVNIPDDPMEIVWFAGYEQSSDSSADMTGQLIHKESTQKFQREFGKAVFKHSRWIMALTGQFEKA